jgi:hypothetical protein
MSVKNAGFTFDVGCGEPIAKVVKKQGDKSKKSQPIVHLDTDNEAFQKYPAIQLRDDETFQPVPNTEKERNILYVTGASGSGKSYYTRAYAEEYKKKFPHNEIFLFSSIAEDSSIDKIKDLQRINIKNEDFLKDELTAKDFANSLVIFDDTDVIPDKKVRSKVNAVRDSILETGRHFKVYCVFTSHIACNALETKRILNESHSITFFPSSMNGKSLKYLVEGYLGFSKEQTNQIKNCDSRWVTVYKTYPQVILTQKFCGLVKNL